MANAAGTNSRRGGTEQDALERLQRARTDTEDPWHGAASAEEETDPFLDFPVEEQDKTWMQGCSRKEIEDWFQIRVGDTQRKLTKSILGQKSPIQTLRLQRAVWVLKRWQKEVVDELDEFGTIFSRTSAPRRM